MTDAQITNFKGYNGNVNLKRSGVNVQWTPEIIAEYMKCAEDVVYFTETYMKIINVDVGLMNFKLYDYQKDMLRSMADNRYTIIATARQAGKSTTTCAFILWYIIFNPEKVVALLANKGDTAREILGRIQLAYEHLPKWLQQGVVEWNKGSFVLENNSRVIAAATSASAIRGYSINLLFIDEAAFIDNWDEFFTSVFPTISSGQSTKIILVSTPNGMNHFYKLWYDANEKRNSYHPIKITWDRVPGRGIKWKEETLSSMGHDIEKFNQEHCVEFLGSSNTLITGSVLKSLVFKTPIAQNNEGIKQYVGPVENHTYVLVADVSSGKGLDYHAFSVFDVTKMPYQQVLSFRNNQITPGDYASIIHFVAKTYFNAAVLIEINNMGGEVANLLHSEHEYDNILCTENAGRGGKRISSGFSKKGIDRGIITSKTVKTVGCSMLKLLVENYQLIINDFDTINELSTFSKKNASYEAEPGKHDDTVMPLVIFAWLSEQQYFKDLTNNNTLLSIKEKTESDLEDSMLVFGFVSDGHDNYDEEAAMLARSREAWSIDWSID